MCSIPKKYTILRRPLRCRGNVVYQIKALKSFYCGKTLIKKGVLGGYVQSENNLSQLGYCWIGDGACVREHCKVVDNAYVHGKAYLRGNVIVSHNALVGGNARLSDFVQICDNALVYGEAKLEGQVVVTDNSCIGDNAEVEGAVLLDGTSAITGYAQVKGTGHVDISNTKITGRVTADIENSNIHDSCISSDAALSGVVRIQHATIGGDAVLSGVVQIQHATIGGKAKIKKTADYLVICALADGAITFYRTGENSVGVHLETLEQDFNTQFVPAVHSMLNKEFRDEYLATIELVKAHFKLTEGGDNAELVRK